MSQSEISVALNQVNAHRCIPPLSAVEVEGIAASIARYEPDAVNVAIIEDHWAQMHSQPADASSNVIWFSDINAVDVQWLWPGRIPVGRITLLVGLPGKGKSLVTIDAAARVSTGMPWPDGSNCPRGSAILITAEDNPNDTIRPRLDAAGADVSRVGLLSMLRRRDTNGRPIETPFTLADVAELEKELLRLPDCKLVVIDPVGAFLGGGVDAHRDNEVRAVLAQSRRWQRNMVRP
jgi:RecA-family ATPase